jgi:SAM-dependent methyltransferase
VSSAMARIKRWGATAEALAQRILTSVGLRQSETRIASDSQAYWNDPSGRKWKADSHWQDAPVFAGTDLWSRIGRVHLDMAERGARLVGLDGPWNRVLEWGCGGGANAVHFAPRAKEFIGVDISAESLRECARQVDAICGTPFQPIQVDVATPESAVDDVGEPCDLFLSFYVFELIPTPEYGERLLHVARELLVPGGLALIQIKYDEGRWITKPRRRGYRSGLAEMTTYPIAAFWELAVACGFTPESVQLEPRNELDSRYAYFLLSRPDSLA